MTDLESALTKEHKAKTIISVLTEIEQLLVMLDTSLVLSSLQQDHSYKNEYINAIGKVESKCKTLKKLVEGDPHAERVVAKASRNTMRLVELVPQVSEAMEADRDYNFVEFLHDRDYWMEVLHNTRLYGKNVNLLLAYYGKTIEELRPRAVHDREMIKLLIGIAVVVNVVLALSLALMFSRTTAKRLSILMDNIKRFGSGEKLVEMTAGPDEISQLDITFREMADARRRAEQVRRDMVAMVSHDLRTPLSGTIGYVTLLVEGVYGSIPDKPRGVLLKMESELHRLIRLANDLLDIEKIESNSLELLQEDKKLDDIVPSANNAVRGIAEVKGVELKTEYDSESPCYCDSERVIQILVNLLSNSIKFSQTGQTVTLRAFVENGSSRFEVEDQGPGIPLESQALVFSRFKQLEQDAATRSSGSGLGLHICKAFVEAHGGTIGVISEPGKGACFWFTLPGKSA